jgi:hypothetical protein
LWVKRELVAQNVKNVIKRAMLAYWNAGIRENADPQITQIRR